MPRHREARTLAPGLLLALALPACGGGGTGDGSPVGADASDGSLSLDAPPAVDAPVAHDGGLDAPSRTDAGDGGDATAPADAPAPGDAGGSTDAGAGDAGPPARLTLPGGPAHLTFDDEFDGTALDRAKWNRWYVNPGTINNELQFYAPDAFEVAGGTLRIRAERRSEYGFQYTSGAMTTFGAFSQSYGYFEMRARVPAGNGLWPAFWMLSADQSWPPEIDVLENLGQDPNTAYLTYHWKDSAGMHQSDGVGYTGPDYSQDFHTYAVDWRPGVIVWYVDGVERHRVEGSQVTANEMYLLANMAVGGSWPVAPDGTTPFPAYYELDYIRAYQYDAIVPPAPMPWQFGIDSADRDVAPPGGTVNFTVHVRLNQPRPGGVHVQAVLYDNALQNMVLTQNFDVAGPVDPGTIERSFAAALPGDLAPGIYRLSVGMFDGDWTYLGWLSDGYVITVQ